MIFCLFEALAASHSNRNPFFSKSPVPSFSIFDQKTQRSKVLVWLLHQSTSILSTFQAWISSCNSIFTTVSPRTSSMAVQVWGHSKHCWARVFKHPSFESFVCICFELASPNNNCFSNFFKNQVRFRTSPFAKS